MNEKDLKKLYGEHVEKTAPDMEKLWNRIEERIDNEKDDLRETKPDITWQENKKETKTAKIHFGRWLAAAACIAVTALGIRAYSGGKTDSGMKNEPDKRVQIEKTEYSSLSFAYSDGKSYRDYLPDGDEYFVEKEVLLQTDVFVDCRVEKREIKANYCEYTLEVVNVICKDGEDVKVSKEISIASKTPYIMNVDGEYLLPLRKNGSGFSIVFENAPQIEFTDDSIIVFHNGWSALNEDSAECVYPSESIDDFYYDRMRVAYSDSIDSLIDSWESI